MELTRDAVEFHSASQDHSDSQDAGQAVTSS